MKSEFNENQHDTNSFCSFKQLKQPIKRLNKQPSWNLLEVNQPIPMHWRSGGLLILELTIWMLISVWLVSLTLRDEGARSPRMFYWNSWRACKMMRTVRKSTISCIWLFPELVSFFSWNQFHIKFREIISWNFNLTGFPHRTTSHRFGFVQQISWGFS